MIHFPRTELAEQLTRDLRGDNPLSDAPNGVFLAAPRRTGKTMFLRHDLIPALVKADIFPVYVDLWENKSIDPGLLISAALGSAVTAAKSRLSKLADLVSASMSYGPVSVEFKNPDKDVGSSIARLVHEVIANSGRRLCLIVDEAQQSLVSKEGMNAVAAIKSARDQLRIMLVMSGSDRDKLLRMVNSNAAPFFGSRISPLIPLGAPFIQHLVAVLSAAHPELSGVNSRSLLNAFELFGHRPQFLINAINETISSERTPSAFSNAILARANASAGESEAVFRSTVEAMNRIQRSVFLRLCTATSGFRPYDAASLKFYSKAAGKRVTVAAAQAALESLRKRDDPVVWKSERGEYALNDSIMAKWCRTLVDSGKWPPGQD